MSNYFRGCMLLVLMYIILIGLSSCSEDTNINQLFLYPGDQNNSISVLLAKAELEYDKGNFSKALSYAIKAHKQNPYNEHASILLGYIYLSLAHMDSIQIAKVLVSESKDQNDTKFADTSNKTVNLFSSLATVLQVNFEDIQKLGTLQQADSSYNYFQEYDVIYPYDLETARQQDLDIVKNVNEAIKYVCPYVDEDIKLPDIDYRHSSENCAPTVVSRSQRAKAHFLWAFTHLTEAISFYLTLFYKTDDSDTKSNIEKRLDALQTISLTDITGYVKHLKHFIDNVDSIFSISSNSMLNGMLNNLNVTNLAFARLAGVPDDFTKSITQTITEIEAKRALITGATDAEKETKSLKTILTQKMASSLASQITTLAQNNPEQFSAKKTEICDAYTSLTEGTSVLDVCK